MSAVSTRLAGGRGAHDLLFPMADASRPPKAPASDVDEKKKVYLRWASERVYHMPGGVSQTGVRTRGAEVCMIGTQQVEAAREHAALEEAQEEARGQEARVVVGQALADGDEAEADAAEAEPHAGREALEEDVGRDLEHDVGDEKDGEGGCGGGVSAHACQPVCARGEQNKRTVVLDAAQAEVLGEAEGARVGDVDAVQEGY